MEITINLKVEIEDGVFETMCVTPFPDGTFRIEDQSILSDSITIYDVVGGTLDDENCLRQVRVVKKSGWRTFRFLLAKEVIESHEIVELRKAVELLGGHSHRVMGGILLVMMPSGADYDPTTAVSRAAQAGE